MTMEEWNNGTMEQWSDGMLGLNTEDFSIKTPTHFSNIPTNQHSDVFLTVEERE